MVFGIGIFLVGVYCAVLSYKKKCTGEMHQQAFVNIISSSSYKEARKIDEKADDWVWQRS